MSKFIKLTHPTFKIYESYQEMQDKTKSSLIPKYELVEIPHELAKLWQQAGQDSAVGLLAYIAWVFLELDPDTVASDLDLTEDQIDKIRKFTMKIASIEWVGGEHDNI